MPLLKLLWEFPSKNHACYSTGAGGNQGLFYFINQFICAHSWPGHFITPDGLIADKLPANKAGLLISEIDIDKKYYDASKRFRMDAINGKLNSGKTVDDARSKDRTIY